MTKVRFSCVLVCFILLFSGCRQTYTDEEWVTLFNGENLDGWYTWLPSTGKNQDPKGIFKVYNGMLHILDIPVSNQDQEFGYLATDQEYTNYILRLEYKWGEKKFPPRSDLKRDSGVLYYFVGEDKIWPRALECQIQEGDTGDFITLSGTVVDTTVEDITAPVKRFVPSGSFYTTSIIGNEYIFKSQTLESSSNQWTQVEIIVDRGMVTHKINGVVNFQGQNVRQTDPDSPGGLQIIQKGRILLQAEGAEIFYRNIRLKLIR